MNLFKKLLILASLFVMTSCSTVFKNKDILEVYAEPATYYACVAVFELSKGNIADIEEKAETIYEISKVLRGMTQDTPPTQEQFRLAIESAAPNKLHWQYFAEDLSKIYSHLRDRIVDEADEKSVMKLINDIAEGCERAVFPYVD